MNAKEIRMRAVLGLARILCVPVKVRESFLGGDYGCSSKVAFEPVLTYTAESVPGRTRTVHEN
jgi:hypothetical protein